MSSAEPPARASVPLPTVAALEGLWVEVRRKPLWAPPNFWRYAKLRARMGLTLMDPATVQVAARPGKVNDCKSCTDICCIGPRSTVLLRLRDIATLVDIGRTDLITHDKPAFSPEELASRPALARNIGSEGWQRFPVLARSNVGACKALTLNGKCGLYPHWPLSCARFPYSLHADDHEVFYSTRCDSFWVRPDAEPRVLAMRDAAVAAYNERIKDAILLAYAPERVADLGLLQFLAPQRAENPST